jgi:hypothetical protein
MIRSCSAPHRVQIELADHQTGERHYCQVSSRGDVHRMLAVHDKPDSRCP